MAGVRMLQAGGNAFDAVAATAAAQRGGTYMSGLAGLGLATVYTAHDGQLRSLDFHPRYRAISTPPVDPRRDRGRPQRQWRARQSRRLVFLAAN